MPDEVQSPEPVAAGAAPVEERCWYCKSAAAEEACAARAALHADARISNVEPTITGGYRITKTWRALKVSIPRCRRCAGAHVVRSRCLAGSVLLFFLAAVGAVVWNHTEFDRFFAMVGIAVVAGLVAAGLGSLLGRFAGRMVTPREIPDESYSKEHPAVQLLVAQGWKPGGDPEPGEEYKDR